VNQDVHRHGEHHDLPDVAELFTAGFWDERYGSKPAVWGGRPNQRLVERAADLAPGTALDVGCGEGADAIWLADCGWRVTAVELSSVALERGAAAAAAHGYGEGNDRPGGVDWVHADLTAWSPPQAAYDLVSAQFLQLPTGPREVVVRRLAAAVAPGGLLLVVGHHPSDLHTTVRRPPLPELFFTAEDVAALLEPSSFDVLASEARPRPATDSEGRTVTVRDAVLVARRTA
jgi:SAM-dependent methyltransferase